MSLKGKHLIIPLLDATLNKNESFDLGTGCSITAIPRSHVETLSKAERVSAYYKRGVREITIGLRFTPTEVSPKRELSFIETLKTAIFCCMVIRLATGVPIDLPFWFDCSEEDALLDFEKTLVRTYRNGPKYTYPLDQGLSLERLEILAKGLNDLVQLALEKKDKNRIIRAIEFASIGFQTYHIPTRLVNQVTFLETLFTTSRHEITFQLSSRVSWYLGYRQGPKDREKIFNLVKEVYKSRSQVVHGENTNNPTRNAREKLLKAEELNTDVFNSILQYDHIQVLSMPERKRDEQLKKLSLGLPNDFFN